MQATSKLENRFSGTDRWNTNLWDSSGLRESYGFLFRILTPVIRSTRGPVGLESLRCLADEALKGRIELRLRRVSQTRMSIEAFVRTALKRVRNINSLL